MSNSLKLMALDPEDLTVIAAHVQDAVVKSSEIEFVPETGTLSLPINRFAWEAKAARRLFSKSYERRRAMLDFKRVDAVQTKSMNRNDPDEVLSILSLSFEPAAGEGDPSGKLDVIFAGNARMSAQVECIEVLLTDLGAAWTARGKPRHTG